MGQKKKIKVAIVVLAVLLVLSLAALSGTLIYSKIAGNAQTIVTVPDNLITPEEAVITPKKSPLTQAATASTAIPLSSAAPIATKNASQATAAEKEAATITLYNKQPEENAAFSVGNMFPGDSETKYFRVQVSYHDSVTVHFKATVRPGYEKLAEVMNVTVKLLSTGETMYDGFLKDMPDSIAHRLSSAESTTDDLYYEITASLDTSVGNDYQNQDLIADFNWWVEGTENLNRSPKTGDTSSPLLWICLAAVSGGAIAILLIVRRRKEAEKDA